MKKNAIWEKTLFIREIALISDLVYSEYPVKPFDDHYSRTSGIKPQLLMFVRSEQNRHYKAGCALYSISSRSLLIREAKRSIHFLLLWAVSHNFFEGNKYYKKHMHIKSCYFLINFCNFISCNIKFLLFS